MLQKLKNHVLAQTFRELKGNPKWSICTEPLWFIPYSLFVPFQTLYMRKLGLTSLEIGTTLTVGCSHRRSHYRQNGQAKSNGDF